ncbi:MAG: RNA polymerase sigma factor [Planctomycetota bacterium]
MSPGEEMTDEELMHRFQQGDQDAYEQLVLRNMGLVMRMAMRYIPDPASAEDISQQVFVRIWQSMDQFREARSFKGWISTITRNLSLNEIRTRKRKNWNPRSVYSDPDQSTEAGTEWLGRFGAL